nr:Glycerate kinase [Klebsiella pneumoniae]
MKIVIALDSFKGSCSAQAACAAVAQGLRRVDQTLELVEMPVSDGGEGLLSTLADSPLLKGRCGNSSAVPRLMASPAGGFPDPARRAGHYRDGAKLWARTHAASAADVRQASSYGLGEQVKAALDAGCRHLIIGRAAARPTMAASVLPGARRTILA